MPPNPENTLPRLLGWTAEGLFYALLLFAVFSHGAVEAWSLSMSHLMVCAVALLSAAGLLASGERWVRLPLLCWLLLALLLWGMVSWGWFSIYRQASLESLLKLNDYLLVAFFVYSRFVREADQKRLVLTLTLLGVLVAGWGLIRYFAVSQGLLSRLGNESVGATAPYVNHNHFAGCLELTLAAGAGLFAANWGRSRIEFGVLLGAGLVLIFVALLFSLSRGGILSLLAAAGVPALVYLARSRERLSFSPVLVLVIFTLGYLWVLQTDRVEARLKTLGDERTMLTLNSRTTAWRSALAAIRERPLAGYGPGNFASVYPRFRESGLAMFFDYAHNDYLQLWVEYGLAGVLLVLAGLGSFLSGLGRLLFKAWEPRDYLSLGLGVGILALVLHSVADFNLQLQANALLFVSLAALFSRRALSLHKSRRVRDGHSLSLRWVVLALACFCLAGSWLAVPGLQAGLLARETVDSRQQLAPLEVAALYRTASDLVPGDAGYAFRAGQNYALAASQNDMTFFLGEARRYMERALSLNPASSEYWIGKALLEAARGDSAEAERCFRGALAADPRNPACFFYLSDFLLERGRLEEAVAVSREGLEIYPSFIGQRLRRVWGKSQDPELLSRLTPEGYSQGHFILAQHFFNQGLQSQSLAELRLCNAETKWGNPYFYLSGRDYQALGMPDSAESSYRVGIKKRPPELQCYRMLATLLASQGRDTEVEALFNQGLGLALGSEDGPLRYEYALYLSRKKDYSRMRQEIEAALSRDVNNVSYLELLADSYLGEKRYYEALKELRRVEVLKPDRVSVLRKIASIYDQTGQMERAREYCIKIINIDPNNSYALGIIAIPKGSDEKNKRGEGI
ncbi:O-antigen ligase family protein [bacterium]|nr:O-antigen ligase family protein [bacterium]